MRKILVLLLCVIIALPLVACGGIEVGEKSPYDVVNDFEYASMKVLEVSDENQVTVEFSYTGEHELTYGEYFEIEMLRDGSWYQLENNSNLSYFDIAYVVAPGKTSTKLYAAGVYGNLPTGQYRIIVEVHDFIGTGNYAEHILAAEFVKE